MNIMTFVGFAGFGGMAAAGMGLFLHSHYQDNIRKLPFYYASLDVMNANPKAIEMIGAPIKVKAIAINDIENNSLTSLSGKLAIPIKGKKLSGNIMVQADREDINSEWRLRRVDFHTKDKKFLLFKASDEDVKKDGTS